jgi:GTP-binding protein LepA
VATGLKSIADARVGDTLTSFRHPAPEPLPGYRPALPLVFAGIYPLRGDEYPLLRDALDKLHLNDGSFVWEPESSAALGHGFRCGFLGLLHMEIVQERLEREFDLDLIASAPSVEYRIVRHGGAELAIDNPAQMPDPGEIETISEPWVSLQVITPTEYVGPVMELTTACRGTFGNMEYLTRVGQPPLRDAATELTSTTTS